MADIILDRSPINPEALDAELRAALGGKVSGISARRGQVVVHLTDEAIRADEDQARSIVLNHDPAALTPQQAAEQARRTLLAQARQLNALPLDVAAYSGESALIQALAERIAWLELEIVQLGGGPNAG